MRAIFTEEQEMLRSTASRIADSVSVTTPADLARLDRTKAWAALAEAGLLGMRARDEDGMPLASGVEVMLVAQSLSSALAPTPFVGAVLAAELLERVNAPKAWVGDIAEGRALYAPLLAPGLDRLADADDLKGAICIDADRATYGLALAREGSDLRLARVDLADMAALPGVDMTRPLGALGDAKADLVGDPLSEADLKQWTSLALTLVCADIVGVLGEGLRRVVEYSKTRIQYGVPIGSFQAVQHMCAEMLVETQAAASVTNYAAWAVDALDADAGLLAARGAKAYCAPVAQKVGEMLMQAYGGIGQTWEHEAHMRTRRAMFDRKIFGDEAHQLLAIANLRMGRN